MNQALRAPEVREKLTGLAYDLVGGTPKEFADYVKAEIVKWGRVVREGNIKAD
jgi:tripartite-type tricarboxylate transporter receptor subunit TctC